MVIATLLWWQYYSIAGTWDYICIWEKTPGNNSQWEGHAIVMIISYMLLSKLVAQSPLASRGSWVTLIWVPQTTFWMLGSILCIIHFPWSSMCLCFIPARGFSRRLFLFIFELTFPWWLNKPYTVFNINIYISSSTFNIFAVTDSWMHAWFTKKIIITK